MITIILISIGVVFFPLTRQENQNRGSSHSDTGNENGNGIDREIPGLVGRCRHDASSDDDSSAESYMYGENEQQQKYHTDNDNSSVDDSETDSDNTISGIQERTRDNSGSDDDSGYNQGGDSINNHEIQQQEKKTKTSF